MSTASRMLEVARKEIGVREGRDRNGNWNNRVKYNDWYVDVLKMGSAFRTSAWCAIFVSWVARQAGVPTSVIPNHAWTPSGDAFFRSKNRRVSTPRAGDIFYVYYPTRGRVAHVGIVESYSNGYITTIEGNTNTSGSSQGNGVYRLRRRVTSNIRVYRPAYTSVGLPNSGVTEKWDGKSYPGRQVFKVGVRHEANTILGHRLVAHGFGRHYKVGPGPVFGEADKRNVMDFQRAQGWKGSDADGYPGPESWKRLMAAPKGATKPPTPPTTHRTLSRGMKGADVKKLQSELLRVFPAYAGRIRKNGGPTTNFGPATEAVVKEFQKRAGVGVSGIVGPQTHAALKKHGVRL